MPITKLLGEAAYTRSEVAFLGRVFDRLSEGTDDEAERDLLAARLLAAFRCGMTEEEDLIESLSRSSDRR